ncbi:MAG: GNAT family N-acetyltransferase, partial [Solirubrobacterales bacterium]
MTPTMIDSVALRRLTTQDLPAIVGWFQDPDTSRFLGGPDWPVGYVDCGTFDHCAVYGGAGQDGPIILETIEAITGAIAFTIDPARRREGLATQTIRALINHPHLSTVELFEAGVEPQNHASRRTLE